MKAETIDRRALPPGAVFSTWRTPDGWPLRRMDWLQPKGASARGNLLFASGRGDFIEKYIEAIGHWYAQGWNVTAFDWRGQGDSRGDIIGGHLDSFDPLVDDAAALIEAWLGERDGPHVAIAHSMGGHLLLRTLAERHPKLDAAVLVAPMIGINATPIPTWLGRRVARALAGLGLNRRRAWKQNERPAPGDTSRQTYLTSSLDRYGDELWWRIRHPAYDLGPPTWGWLNAAYRSIKKLSPEALAGVTIPVLIVGAARDRLVSPTAIRRAIRALPKVEAEIFPDAAHEILRESDPIRLAALDRIDGFFDRYAG